MKNYRVLLQKCSSQRVDLALVHVEATGWWVLGGPAGVAPWTRSMVHGGPIMKGYALI